MQQRLKWQWSSEGRPLYSLLFVLLCVSLMSKPVRAQILNKDTEIVYLDMQGYIRVLDLVQVNSPAVQWVSPVGGWQDFALGDFNGDGDAEIVAIAGNNTGGYLAIYDPVVASGLIDPDQTINGIPWQILFGSASSPTGVVNGSPLLVAVGELEPTVAGDEIAYISERLADDQSGPTGQSLLTVLRATNGEGRAWEKFAEQPEFGNVWTEISLGDPDGSGVDEVLLVDDAGILRLYRLEAGLFVRYFDRNSDSQPWQSATIARFLADALPEIMAVRSAPLGSTSLLGFDYEPADAAIFIDVYSEFFSPSPKRLFAGDINGSGDEEIFFLRLVPSTNNTVSRLIMRNRGNDSLPAFEEVLDTDNGFESGTAADVDGDGKAEVILIRNTKLRVYSQPEISKVFTDYPTPVTANPRTVRAANLDQIGYVKTPEFQVTNSSNAVTTNLAGSIAAGGESGAQNFTIRNIGVGGNIPFSVRTAGNSTWLRLTGERGQTPAAVGITFDARMLAAGVYTTTLFVESSNTQVSNTPFALTVTLTVRAGLLPHSLGLFLPSCTGDPPHDESLTIDGPTNMTFTARIVPSSSATSAGTITNSPRGQTGLEWPSTVPWVTAQSANVVPTTLTLTFTPAQLEGDMGEAILELVAADAQGEQLRRVPLNLLCTQSKLYLPLVTR